MRIGHLLELSLQQEEYDMPKLDGENFFLQLSSGTYLQLSPAVDALGKIVNSLPSDGYATKIVRPLESDE
jgi:hypothetical protein